MAIEPSNVQKMVSAALALRQERARLLNAPTVPEVESERWSMVLIAPKYEVSTWGRVRNAKTGHVLRVSFANGKYPRVTMQTVKGECPVMIARQVMLAFGPPIPRMSDVVGYRDGNIKNVRFENLYWRNHSEVRKMLWDTGVYTKRQTYAFRAEDLRKAVIARQRAYWAQRKANGLEYKAG